MSGAVAGPLTHWEGEPVSTVEGLLEVPRFEAWGEISSTNDRIRTLAVDEAPAWTVVVAERQTSGRGRGGRSWSSPPGAGLWASILLRPPAAGTGGLLSILAGLALARAVEAESGVPIGLKWPNDLWVDGRKAAGILCEVEGDAVAVGIGVNVRPLPADVPSEVGARAVSLEEVAQHVVGRLSLLRRLVRELRRLVDRPVLRLDDDLLREWRRHDVLLGRRVRVAGIVGRAAGLGSGGHLILDTDAGESRPVAAGHVEFLDGPAEWARGE